MASKLTPEQKIFDREIRRINRQIEQSYKKLGSESRLSNQYASLLYGIDQSRGKISSGETLSNRGLIREVNGIPQISRSKSSLNIIGSGGATTAVIKQLGRMQTVQHAQKAIIAAYEKREGKKVRGKSEKERIVKQESERYTKMEKSFRRSLQELYAIENERGIRLEVVQRVKDISRGRYTSEEDFEFMQKIVEDELEKEDHEIVQDVLPGY